MKFPFFASFIVFCLWLSYEIHKRRNLDAKSEKDFWEKEAAANATRRKSLDNLQYIQIPFDRFAMDLFCDDPQIAEYQETLRELSTNPIVNFTGISNTDLKLQYGAPNIKLLSSYDQRYTILARTLQDYGNALYQKGCLTEACVLLTFAVETKTDIKATYCLLAKIYQKQGTPEKIRNLKATAMELNSAMKGPILAMLSDMEE